MDFMALLSASRIGTAVVLVAMWLAQIQGGPSIPGSGWLDYGQLGAIVLLMILWALASREERRRQFDREDSIVRRNTEALERHAMACQSLCDEIRRLIRDRR